LRSAADRSYFAAINIPELQVTFQQTHWNGCTDGTENANPCRVGDGFRFAPLLLLRFPFPIVSAGFLCRVVNRTRRIAAHLAKLALLIALRDDGFGGELAGLELGPLGLLFRRRLLGTNLGVLVAWESGTTSTSILDSAMRFTLARRFALRR
jgi:hypothetical protein